MPYTVWGAFDAFRKNTVDLDPDVTKKARGSRDYLFDQLKLLSKNIWDFPRLGRGYIPYGSFARNTKIRPLDDIDFLVLLNGQWTTAKMSTGTPHTYWLWINDVTSPLADFHDDYGYVNSTKILNKIKNTLASVSNYKKAEIRRNMQAVTLSLTSYAWTFDIVPAVPVNDGSGGDAYYLIPNGSGDWIRTDPRIDAANVTALNTQHSGSLLPTIRLLKYWNRRTHKPRLPSYYFETLVLKVFRYAGNMAGFPQAIKYFFDRCPSHLLSSCPDPKGLGPSLDMHVDLETKLKVRAAMLEASKFANCAMLCERLSRPKEAISWWGRIFGPEFPSYG